MAVVEESLITMARPNRWWINDIIVQHKTICQSSIYLWCWVNHQYHYQKFMYAWKWGGQRDDLYLWVPSKLHLEKKTQWLSQQKCIFLILVLEVKSVQHWLKILKRQATVVRSVRPHLSAFTFGTPPSHLLLSAFLSGATHFLKHGWPSHLTSHSRLLLTCQMFFLISIIFPFNLLILIITLQISMFKKKKKNRHFIFYRMI